MAYLDAASTRIFLGFQSPIHSGTYPKSITPRASATAAHLAAGELHAASKYKHHMIHPRRGVRLAMTRRRGTRLSILRPVGVGALAVLMLITVVCGISSGPAGAYPSGIDSGRFNIYAGGALIGTEDFAISADEAKCVVELNVGGQALRLDVALGARRRAGSKLIRVRRWPGRESLGGI